MDGSVKPGNKITSGMNRNCLSVSLVKFLDLIEKNTLILFIVTAETVQQMKNEIKSLRIALRRTETSLHDKMAGEVKVSWPGADQFTRSRTMDLGQVGQ